MSHDEMILAFTKVKQQRTKIKIYQHVIPNEIAESKGCFHFVSLIIVLFLLLMPIFIITFAVVTK